MNSTDNTQSKNKENPNEVTDESEYGSRVKNVKVYTSFTVRTNKDRLNNHIKECIHHIQKDIQLQNDANPEKSPRNRQLEIRDGRFGNNRSSATICSPGSNPRI